MNNFSPSEIWLITGSQHLYGPEPLAQVSRNAEAVASGLAESELIPVKIVCKGVATRPEEIKLRVLEANSAENCIGIIFWMHTFSPGKMWIAGLKKLQKPFMHLHTQFNRDLPWDKIDMDFMNLNQSAHAGREFGFIASRMRIDRKVVAGHWQDKRAQEEIGVWARAAAGIAEAANLKVARFGDNMREVAVTEGDKVGAQITFGYSVNGYGVGDLVKFIDEINDAEVERQIEVYRNEYAFAEDIGPGTKAMEAVKREARIELGTRAFLEDGGFGAFTNTFENLHGLPQLPGLATQRLMAEGYGYGGEGDWKTAALLRIMKVMSKGLPGGTSFMEDYTYHFGCERGQVLGAHMLELCPSIAEDKPEIQVHPLGIGGKDDPVRLVFTASSGPAINATLIDMGDRFRLVVNLVKTVKPQNLPRLPVARALWEPHPNLRTAAATWILAGGTHHTVFTQSLSLESLADFAEMAGIEMLLINESTDLYEFKKELHWNEAYFSTVHRG